MRRIIFAILVIVLFSIPSLAKYSGGTGDPNTPYEIANATDLMTLANDTNDYNKCFIMISDIDLDPNLPGNQVFRKAVIGRDVNGSNLYFDGRYFRAGFDGNGYKILNMTIDTNDGNDCLGLFGSVIYATNKEIKNITLENINIRGGNKTNFIGGLVAYNQGGIIRNCSSSGVIKTDSNSMYFGGLIGYNTESPGGSKNNIIDCCSSCVITGDINSSYFGGIAGYSNYGTVESCHSDGIIKNNGISSYIGGLIGFSASKSVILNCYSEANIIDAAYHMGGLVGQNDGSIINSYSTGYINTTKNFTTQNVGGLVGLNNGVIDNSFSSGNVNFNFSWYSGGLAGRNNGNIKSCYSTGTVSGLYSSSNLGGLIGISDGNIINCYSISSVTEGETSAYIGGLAGHNRGNIIKCFSRGTVPFMPYSGGLVGEDDYTPKENIISSYFLNNAGPNNGNGISLTDEQFKMRSSFAGWDFIKIWFTEEGLNYPELKRCGLSPEYSGGSGAANDPYQISNASDLLNMAIDVGVYSKSFVLTADINLDPNLPGNFIYPEAVIAAQSWPVFKGVFDGAGHKIINLTIDTNGMNTNYLGLFGNIWCISIENVNLENVNIKSGWLSKYIGGLVGYNWANEIYNCSSTGNIIAGETSWYIGGLIGASKSSHVTNCFTECNIFGTGNLGGLIGYDYESFVTNCNSKSNISNYFRNSGSGFGGLVGYAEHSNINHCFATGDVNGDAYVGGLVGYQSGGTSYCYASGKVSGRFEIGGLVGNKEGGIISNCYSTCSVIGGDWCAGLVGTNWGGNIDNSYSTGNVSGYSSIGGFIGVNNEGIIRNCYSIGEVNSSSGGGFAGYNYATIINDFYLINSGPDNNLGEPLTDQQMKQKASFIGWDFNDIWTIKEAITYPRLAWDNSIQFNIVLDSNWMYQNMPNKDYSSIMAQISDIDDPCGNSSYMYYWSIELPDDVNVGPRGGFGGVPSTALPKFPISARGCDVPFSISDSGQTFKVICEIVGDRYGNTGRAEKEFAIALLGDTNNDGVVNIADRSIINAFWRNGSAGAFTLKDCDINCDGVVNIADRSIANSIWRGALGTNYVSTPCPLR